MRLKSCRERGGGVARSLVGVLHSLVLFQYYGRVDDSSNEGQCLWLIKKNTREGPVSPLGHLFSIRFSHTRQRALSRGKKTATEVLSREFYQRKETFAAHATDPSLVSFLLNIKHWPNHEQ